MSAGGKAVSKESLLTQVWGNEIVEENNLQAQISAIPRCNRILSCGQICQSAK
ncbi:hypothetical protein [Rahnella bonaserana]|uniref:hypothetical protein n=1 Tax=Rahnella bonaserana TaxID=2816248 RepID=UPI003D329F0E